MRAHIIRVGNSKGVRIPKTLLAQTGLAGEVEITASKNALVIRPVVRPRAGWGEAFAAMAQRGDDRLLEGAAPLDHSFDEEEWEWK
jgi:antitoxin MazE